MMLPYKLFEKDFIIDKSNTFLSHFNLKHFIKDKGYVITHNTARIYNYEHA